MGEHRARTVLDDAGDRAEFAGHLAGLGFPGFARTVLACVSGSAADICDLGSDWHWMSGACWAESVRRGCPGFYARMIRGVSGDGTALPG